MAAGGFPGKRGRPSHHRFRIAHRLWPVLLLLGSQAMAGVDPHDWLARMSRALSELTYQGEFSYLNGRELSSLSITHTVIDGRSHERLVHLNGAPREIIRNGDRVVCVLRPGDRLLELDRSIPAGPFARAFSRSLEQLPPGYTARLDGRGRVAGREALRVDVLPVDEHRYGYRLWLDQASALLLRSELLSADEVPLEIFQFVRLEVGGTVEPDEVAIPTGEELILHPLGIAEPETSAGSGTAPAWDVAWLPSGFRMAASDVRRPPRPEGGKGARGEMETLMYSDGLATFSVFVERAPGRASYAHQARRGATVAVMDERAAEGGGPPWLVTVVGEIPMATAARIAASVRPRAAAAP